MATKQDVVLVRLGQTLDVDVVLCVQITIWGFGCKCATANSHINT